jgi:phage host-nuclease inhibitor protein Gam
MGDEPSIETLTKVYIKIRDKRAELAAKFKEEDDALKENMNKIRAALLQYCKDNNIESARTSEGLFYRTVRTTYWTSDWQSMHQFIMDNGVPEFLEKRLNQAAVKQYLQENPEALPPGLNVNSEYTISVRKK